MDAGGRAPTVGALGDAGAVAESFRDWVPKLELGNQRICILIRSRDIFFLANAGRNRRICSERKMRLI